MSEPLPPLTAAHLWTARFILLAAAIYGRGRAWLLFGLLALPLVFTVLDRLGRHPGEPPLSAGSAALALAVAGLVLASLGERCVWRWIYRARKLAPLAVLAGVVLELGGVAFAGASLSILLGPWPAGIVAAAAGSLLSTAFPAIPFWATLRWQRGQAPADETSHAAIKEQVQTLAKRMRLRLLPTVGALRPDGVQDLLYEAHLLATLLGQEVHLMSGPGQGSLARLCHEVQRALEAWGSTEEARAALQGFISDARDHLHQSGAARGSNVGDAAAGPALLCASLIRAYQQVAPPMPGRRCCHRPSCSRYAELAVVRFGVLRGGWMALGRMLRCSPSSAGGYDPVPSRPPSFPPADI